jgi:hypothetical protein
MKLIMLFLVAVASTSASVMELKEVRGYLGTQEIRVENLEDRHYTAIDSVTGVWSVYREIIHRYGLVFDGASESNDCDDAASLWIRCANIYTYRQGHKAAAAAFLGKTRTTIAALGMSSSDRPHGVVVFRHTKKGWCVLEPHTNRYVRLGDYPNKIIYVRP